MLITRRIEQCPYCGSKNIIVDYSTGTIVCKNCGAVIDDMIYDVQEQGYAKNPRGERHTITELEAIRFSFNKLKTSIRIAKKLREKDPNYVVKLYQLLQHDEEILHNNCIIEIARRLNSRFKIALIEIAKSLRNGEYPLISYLSKEYNIPRKRIKKLIRDVSKCID